MQKRLCKPGFVSFCPRPDRCYCLPKKGGLKGLGDSMSMYNPHRYPEGVPNPFEPAVEVYPNYVHGSDYTRPYFAQPYQPQPYNVVSGLGEIERAARTKSVLAGAGAGAAALAVLAAVAVDARKGRAIATGAVLGGLVGLAAAWTAVAVAEAPA